MTNSVGIGKRTETTAGWYSDRPLVLDLPCYAYREALPLIRAKMLGPQPGQRPKSDRLAPKVLALVAQGRSYRLVGREVGLSKTTVARVVKRIRATLAGS